MLLEFNSYRESVDSELDSMKRLTRSEILSQTTKIDSVRIEVDKILTQMEYH